MNKKHSAHSSSELHSKKQNQESSSSIQKKWHALSIDELYEFFQTSSSGLTTDIIKKNKQQYGLNQLPKKDQPSILRILFSQVNNLLNYVLIAAAFFSAITAHWIDFWVIVLILTANTAIGIYHHLKAQKIVSSLADSFEAETVVIRAGKSQKILVSELIPGDIVVLKDGDAIPADVRFIEAQEVSCIESSLTGESKSVSKHIGQLAQNTPLAERANLGFTGTTMVTGEAKGLVVATGSHTEIGSIAVSLNKITEEKTLFEKRTDTLAKQMVLITFTVSGLIFVIGLLRNMPLDDLILFVLATLISGIPEVLPTVLIVVLSIAALRMSQRKALLKKLSAIESLSTVTTIITDKTGTLTENNMTVRKVILPDLQTIQVTGTGWEPRGDFFVETAQTKSELTKIELTKSELTNPIKDPLAYEPLYKLGLFGGFNDQADIIKKNGIWDNIGDPTEASRVVLSRKIGIESHSQSEAYSILFNIPYNQETKCRQTIVQNNNTKEITLIVVGGTEHIISRSTANTELKKQYQDVSTLYAAQAFRMQAVGIAPLSLSEQKYESIRTHSISVQELEKWSELRSKLELLGILVIQDPIRADVPEAVEKAKKAGITVIMATGDHPATAQAIGIETGILKHAPPMTSDEVMALNDSELLQKLQEVTVFARMTPASKQRIATVLQNSGVVIAMTGDGTNDAPALKQADVGIAMGQIGTDAAREASDLIILDDNFATIIAAIEEGRTVFRNVRQTSLFLLTTNFSEGLAMFLSMLLGLGLPLLPLQILWLNLVTDGVSGVALATEKPQHTTLNSPPRKRTDGILSKKNLIFILSIAAVMTTGTLLTYAWFMNSNIEYARTAAFVFLVFTNLFNMINLRSLDLPIREIGFFSNKTITISFGISTFLMGIILFVPFLRDIFSFAPISPLMIVFLFVASSNVFFVGELLKKAHTID